MVDKDNEQEGIMATQILLNDQLYKITETQTGAGDIDRIVYKRDAGPVHTGVPTVTVNPPELDAANQVVGGTIEVSTTSGTGMNADEAAGFALLIQRATEDLTRLNDEFSEQVAADFMKDRVLLGYAD